MKIQETLHEDEIQLLCAGKRWYHYAVSFYINALVIFQGKRWPERRASVLLVDFFVTVKGMNVNKDITL